MAKDTGGARAIRRDKHGRNPRIGMERGPRVRAMRMRSGDGLTFSSAASEARSLLTPLGKCMVGRTRPTPAARHEAEVLGSPPMRTVDLHPLSIRTSVLGFECASLGSRTTRRTA